MKLSLKKLFNSQKIVKIRNLLSLKPLPIMTNNISNDSSVSDAFLWRTDNGYKTIFRFTDLVNNFFEYKNTSVELHFFNKEHLKVTTFNIENLENVNEIVIDKKMLNNTEDYGVFYIFHNSFDKFKTSIRNSCYTGYSLNNCLPSFVHGNCPTAVKMNNKISFNLIGRCLLKNQIYTIQRLFETTSSLELVINNPLNHNLYLEINNSNYVLKANFTKIIKIKSNKKIKLKSNCFFLRPIIFEKKNNFINVHHA